MLTTKVYQIIPPFPRTGRGLGGLGQPLRPLPQPLSYKERGGRLVFVITTKVYQIIPPFPCTGRGVRSTPEYPKYLQFLAFLLTESPDLHPQIQQFDQSSDNGINPPQTGQLS